MSHPSLRAKPIKEDTCGVKRWGSWLLESKPGHTGSERRSSLETGQHGEGTVVGLP